MKTMCIYLLHVSRAESHDSVQYPLMSRFCPSSLLLHGRFKLCSSINPLFL